MNGTKKWWSRESLMAFGQMHCQLRSSEAEAADATVREAIAITRSAIQEYIHAHAHFETIGKRMLAEWQA